MTEKELCAEARKIIGGRGFTDEEFFAWIEAPVRLPRIMNPYEKAVLENIIIALHEKHEESLNKEAEMTMEFAIERFDNEYYKRGYMAIAGENLKYGDIVIINGFMCTKVNNILSIVTDFYIVLDAVNKGEKVRLFGKDTVKIKDDLIERDDNSITREAEMTGKVIFEMDITQRCDDLICVYAKSKDLKKLTAFAKDTVDLIKKNNIDIILWRRRPTIRSMYDDINESNPQRWFLTMRLATFPELPFDLWESLKGYHTESMDVLDLDV
jgi:hypothetical protein